MSNLNENDKYLTKQEVKSLFGVIKSKRDRAIFLILYFHGLRASEVGRLQLSSYSPKERRLFIGRRKGSLTSNPELSPQQVRSLNAWLAVRPKGPGALFTSNRRTGIDRRMIWVLIRKYCAAAGIDCAKAHPHILKHSIATHLLQSGVDVFTVKKILGHKKITSTEVYLHMVDAHVDDAVRKFQEEW